MAWCRLISYYLCMLSWRKLPVVGSYCEHDEVQSVSQLGGKTLQSHWILSQFSHARAASVLSKNFTSMCTERTVQWENSTQQTVIVLWKGLRSLVHGSVSVYACILVCTHIDKSKTLPIPPSPSSYTVRVLVKEAHSSLQPFTSKCPGLDKR